MLGKQSSLSTLANALGAHNQQTHEISLSILLGWLYVTERYRSEFP